MILRKISLILLFAIFAFSCSGGSSNDSSTGQTVPLSDYQVTSVTFADLSNLNGKISGTVFVAKAHNESKVTHYAIHWGSSSNTKIASSSLIARIAKTGSDVSYNFGSPVSIPSGATYIIAYSEENGSEWSPKSVMISDFADETAPAAGTITLGTKTTNKINISWSAASDGTTSAANLKYSVYRSLSGNISSYNDAAINGTKVADWTANLLSSQLTGLSSDTTYYINVFVKDDYDNISAYTTVNSKTVKVVPIDWWNFQFPSTSQTVTYPSQILTYGQYYSSQVTIISTPSSTVMVQLGWYKTSETVADARYVDAVFNTNSGNNDEYKATTAFESSGNYKMFYRYSGDLGDTWNYSSEISVTVNP